MYAIPITQFHCCLVLSVPQSPSLQREDMEAPCPHSRHCARDQLLSLGNHEPSKIPSMTPTETLQANPCVLTGACWRQEVRLLP